MQEVNQGLKHPFPHVHFKLRFKKSFTGLQSVRLISPPQWHDLQTSSNRLIVPMRPSTYLSQSVATITACVVLQQHPLHAAGFQLAERSAAGLGRAFSGEAAIADDASVISSNPAGMILLDDNSISVGLQYIAPQVDVKGRAATPGGLVRVKDSDVAKDPVVPYFYYTRKVNDKLTLGLGTYSTFGLATDYSSEFAAIAGTDLSEITTVTINPSFAYRFSEHLTLGLGLDIVYAEGQISNTSGGNTVFDLEGDDWAAGWNIGALYEINDRTRVGLHYRSSIELDLEGDAKLGPPIPVPPHTSLPADLNVKLPDSVEASVYHQINDQWAIHGDILWTHWSQFKELAPSVGIAPIDDSLLTEENWDDAFRYAIGTTYTHSEKLTLRAGLAFDESPSSDDNRTLRIPDSDRIWLSIGASVQLNPCYKLDLGYTHIFAKDSDIEFLHAGGNDKQFSGTASGDVNLFGLGISGSF